MAAIEPARALQRSIDVSRLDVGTFEAIEDDRSATVEAGVVVAITTIIGAVGSLFVNGIWGFVVVILFGLAGWYLWAWLAAQIARVVFNISTTDTGEMLRTTGYAHAPRVLGIVPLPFFWLIGALWSLVAIVIGMRQAGEMTTIQAIIASALGLLPWVIGMSIVEAIF